MCFQEMRQAGRHFADTIQIFVSFNRSSKSTKRLIWLGWIFKFLMDSSRMSTGAYFGLGEKRNAFFLKVLKLARDRKRTFVYLHKKWQYLLSSSLPLVGRNKWLALYNKHSRVHSVQKTHMQTQIKILLLKRQYCFPSHQILWIRQCSALPQGQNKGQEATTHSV